MEHRQRHQQVLPVPYREQKRQLQWFWESLSSSRWSGQSYDVETDFWNIATGRSSKCCVDSAMIFRDF